MKHHINRLESQVGETIRQQFEGLEDDVEAAFKGANVETKLANISQVLSGINMVNPLMSKVLPVAMSAMDDGAEHHKKKVEKQLADNMDEPADVELRYDVEDTMAFNQLEQDAAREMRHVNDTVKDRVNGTLTDVVDEGGNVDEAIDALQEEVDQIGEDHAELIARTEVMGASRSGSQALAESTDLIGGKEWNASSDGRERPWHAVMNGTVVPKDEEFVVPNVSGADNQPRNYPRECMVVGKDQPFNCRCSQKPVLREDMPEDIKSLKQFEGVKVRRLNDRQQEIYEKHAKEDETFRHMLERFDAEYSRSKMTKHLGISKASTYSWLEEFDLK